MLALDAERQGNPLWYHNSSFIGLMLYLDNFSDSFANMEARLDYLEELGVTYLHIMPIFKMPTLLNDGGYAVSDFRSIDSRYGSDEEFDAFLRACRQRNISVCLDFVLNHSSDEHDWAMRAKAGEKAYQERYFITDDKSVVQAYEEHVNEVFPATAPGNFTYSQEMNSWVLTTFNHFQWDLNYKNPEVFLDMTRDLLQWANRGVDIFRFDAIPYIWKEWGTNSRNLPQVHTLMRMFRLALEIVAPATIIKGEVVMAPSAVGPYFGSQKAPECHLLYNFTFMVELWNALAIRDSRPLRALIEKIPHDIPSGASWINYVRCHDDIGWGFNETVARQMGFDPFSHRQFLIKFYEGSFESSFSRGQLYEFDSETLDARNCGTCASLCGLEKGLAEQNEWEQELAVKRIVLLHAICVVVSGIPVIYSGDEIGQLNDYSYTFDFTKSHDSRFLHRGKFDWALANQRHDLNLPSSKIFHAIKRLIEVRKQQYLLGSANTLTTIETSDHAILATVVTPLERDYSTELLLFLANMSEFQKRFTVDLALHYPLEITTFKCLIQGREVNLDENPLILGPYEFLLLSPA